MDIDRIGKTIAYLRKRAGYTQKELADRMGISDKAVSKWERGQGLPEIGYLRKLSILLDTDSDSLLAGNLAHHMSDDWRGIIVLNENASDIGAGTMVYDKPLISFLLSYFLLVGIKDVYIACSPSDKTYIDRRFGCGSDYGVKLKVSTEGLEAVIHMVEKDLLAAETDLNHSGNNSIMMLYGKTILYGVDQTRFFQKAMVDRSQLTLLVRPKKMDVTLSEDADGEKQVIRSRPMRLKTQYDYSELPFLFFPASHLQFISQVGSIENYIEKQKSNGCFNIEMLDRGFVEIEADNWDCIQDASTFIRIIQDKCGMNVYCLEEVAWRRGFISLEQLRLNGEKYKGTEYGEYILGLYNRIKEK